MTARQTGDRQEDYAVILDCEFLTVEGALRRYWAGPFDPDPIVVQIGAAKLGLHSDFAIRDTLRLMVRPLDRQGRICPIDAFFTELTGITQETVMSAGQPLRDALAALDRFSDGNPFWSWGKDELNMIAVSCYVAGIAPPIAATRFNNACKLLLKAGMPYGDLQQTRSGELADYYSIPHPPLKSHDALDDTLSLTYALQHLLRSGLLSGADFA